MPWDVKDSASIVWERNGPEARAVIAPALLDELSSGGAGTAWEVTQAAHGLSLRQPVRLNGSTYVLANASTPEDAEVVGIVSEVSGPDDFIVQTGGHIGGFVGLTPGAAYFLQDDGTFGIEPGTVSKPLLIADTDTSAFFYNFRGIAPGIDAGTDGATQGMIAHIAVAQDIVFASLNDSHIVFGTVIRDDIRGYDPATGIFTAQRTGWHFFRTNFLVQDMGEVSTRLRLHLVTNTGQMHFGGATASSVNESPLAGSILHYMTEGDTAQIGVYSNASGTITTTASESDRLEILYLGAGADPAALPAEGTFLSSTIATPLPDATWNPIAFDTIERDDLSIVDDTGLITIKTTGWYALNFLGYIFNFPNGARALAQLATPDGGAAIRDIGFVTGQGANAHIHGNSLFHFTAGQQIEVRVYQQSGTDETLNIPFLKIVRLTSVGGEPGFITGSLTKPGDDPEPDPALYPPGNYPPGTLFFPTAHPSGIDGQSMIFYRGTDGAGAPAWKWGWGEWHIGDLGVREIHRAHGLHEVLGRANATDANGNPTPDTTVYPPAEYAEGTILRAISFAGGIEGDMVFSRQNDWGGGNERWEWIGGSFTDSNASGFFTRWADGQQTAQMIQQVAVGTGDWVAFGTDFVRIDTPAWPAVAFPATFAVPPAVSASLDQWVWLRWTALSSTTETRINPIRESASAFTLTARYDAVGRWK